MKEEDHAYKARYSNIGDIREIDRQNFITGVTYEVRRLAGELEL